ncbi:hypothetical protein N431DRAFT_438166 [Stipitochalara longipes BDJ]|nr:hypothetical protein N431DRAFT_438166 [Stipitochalara longipes BDJ]
MVISAPILLNPTPSPPPRRPSRPSSLRSSTIEDMHITPTLTPITHIPNSIPETTETEYNRPTSFRPDPLRFYKDGTTNIPLRGDLIGSPQSEAWRPTSSVYSGNNADHIDMNNTYIPYRGPDSSAARSPRSVNLFPSAQGHSSPRISVHDETLRMLERGEENTVPDTAATFSDGEDDAKSEGSYDWAAARAQKLLAEKRKKRESPPIPEKSPLRSF